MDALARIAALQEQLEQLRELLELVNMPDQAQLAGLMRRNQELLEQVYFLQMLVKNISGRDLPH